MAKDLSDFTVGEGGQIIPLGKGNSDEDSILRIRREILTTNSKFVNGILAEYGGNTGFKTLQLSDPNFGPKTLTYFDSLGLQNITTSSNMIQGERNLDEKIVIPRFYSKLVYQVLPSQPVFNTPTLSDYTLLFSIRIPYEEDSSIGYGFHGFIRDTGTVSVDIKTGNWRKEKITGIHERFLFEMMKAQDYLLGS